MQGLVAFLHTRAAYVAQTALFGYLKTRMGIQFREIFQDDRFAVPLAKARTQVFVACLSDLTVFAIAHVAGSSLSAEACRDAASRCYRAALDGALEGAARADAIPAEAAFDRRLEGVDWAGAAEGDAAFSESPERLIDAAPVIEGYKELDREIVMNSIRFRWIDVRQQFRRGADVSALVREIETTPPG